MAGLHVRPTGQRGLRALLLIITSVSMAVTGCGMDRGLGTPSRAVSSPGPRAVAGASPAVGQAAGSGSSARPLAGKIIGIDPGHNGGNAADPAAINSIIWNGRERETCDTTGTQTDSGYTEASFNWNVARYLRADLRRAGARVVLTRHGNETVGPCVTQRAQILDRANANAAIDIHADGGPAWGRGFTVLEPVADGPNDNIIKASEHLGDDVRSALLKYTGMPESDYYGHDGVISRDNLAGLNLATEPKILIECGNMRDAADARLLTAPWFQRRLAQAFAAAMVAFLGAGH